MKFHQWRQWFSILLVILLPVHSLTYYTTPLKGIPGQGYYFECSFGSNKQELNMLLDSGSANLVVAGAKFSDVSHWYNPLDSDSSSNSTSQIWIQYRIGNISGSMYHDVFNIKTLIDIKERKFEQLPYQTPIAVINSTNGFFGNTQRPVYDGVFGVGYSTISIQAVPGDYKLVSPMDELKAQLDIPDQFLVRFCGTTEAILSARSQSTIEAFNKTLGPTVIKTSGKLVFGDSDTEQIKNFYYVPIVGSSFYEIVLLGIRINKTDLVNNCTMLNAAGTVVDTGTANILLPQPLFGELVKSVHRHLEKTEPSLVQANTSIFSNASMFCYEVNGSDYEFLGAIYTPFPLFEFDILTRSGDIWKLLRLQLSPQNYLRYLGIYEIDAAYKDCFAFAIGPSDGETVVLGLSFLEGFDVIFNRSGRKIGFAESGCPSNKLDSSIPHSKVIGVMDWSPDAAGHMLPHHCSPLLYSQLFDHGLATLHIILLACALVFIAFLTGIVVMVTRVHRKRRIEATSEWETSMANENHEVGGYGSMMADSAGKKEEKI